MLIKNPRTGKEDFQDITSGAWPVNNPEVKAVIRGWLGRYDKTGEAVEPGDYRVTIAAGRKEPKKIGITYTFHVKHKVSVIRLMIWQHQLM